MKKTKKVKKRRLLRYRDVRRWSDFDRMRSYTEFFPNAIRRLFLPQKATYTESFEHAAARYHLDDAQIWKQQKTFFGLAVLMLAVALCVLAFGASLFFSGSYHGAAASVGVTCIALGMAFRYHFWYYQLKARKLGCSIKEWFQNGLLGRS